MTSNKNQIAYRTPTNTDRNNSRLGRARLEAVIILVGLLGIVVACAVERPTHAAPAAAESLFVDAVRAEPARLKSAREAAKRGDYELAIHDYLASIQEDPSTAGDAVAEMVKVFLTEADERGAAGRHVDESAAVNQCYQVLLQLKQADGAARPLSEPARAKVFQEMVHVRSVGNERARGHIMAADQLRREAKGFWNDDEDKQADALHKINLAWSYYPAFTDEWMVSKMYDIWADMKGELPTWQYNQVMERDRLHLGRAVGDRSSL